MLEIDYKGIGIDSKIMSKSIGYTISFTSPVISLHQNNIERFKIYLDKAKTIFISYFINENQDLTSLSKIIEGINTFSSNKTEIIFSTEIDEDIGLGECKYLVVITGLNEI